MKKKNTDLLVKQTIENLQKAEEKRIRRKLNTVNVYSIRRPEKGAPFGYPFYAPSDSYAMQALKQMISDCPPLAGSDLYLIGEFCILDGSIKSIRPKVVLER